ncbi:hypothetical protein KUL42_35880 [Alteromonas sp. KUL42]|uniref:hypothetical protein n=1 Tax=Alteromonas sp. KUL42 TaxID=2480797 RepID=UPI001036DD32|nr:hypothetical protein [Alteromonas sp. KUL42]TAP32210.1 hypothetical protein EYR97_17725 [Alteromonas sp. KUL42]GEA08827.1 hypothetical protein KUL42_35880 [Alteromonas sp. KUL42]
MSMTLYVIMSLNDVPDTNELNELSNKLTVPVIFSENVDLKEHSGFLPAKLNDSDSGVETYLAPLSELEEYFPTYDFSPYEEPVVVTFRWGGNMEEMIVALYSAYLLGYEKQVITFESQSGIYLTNEQVKEGAEAMVNGI